MDDANARLSAANVALAEKLLNGFGRDPDWFDHVAPDVLLELPFGATASLPTRLEGAPAHDLFRTAMGAFDVKFHDVVVRPLADPTQVVAEYRGLGEPMGRVYPQTYVCFMTFRDGKLAGYREYFDTAIVRDVLGDFITPAEG